jgi:TolA-binding protein
MTCPGDVELARALAAGDDPEIAAHLEACASCRAAYDGTRAMIELARELPVALPPPARREEVRTAVLAAAGLGHRPARRAWQIPAIAAAAAAASVVVYLASARPAAEVAHHAHGTVRPHPGARWSVRSIGPEEIVQLGDGVIEVEVEPLRPGERFRVVVGDAELEVRGTAFTVTASAEHLVEVAVAHGRVDLVSIPGSAPGSAATLTAGQSWHAPVAAAPVAAAPVTAAPVAAAPVAAAPTAAAPVAAAPVAAAPVTAAAIARVAREPAERSPAAPAPVIETRQPPAHSTGSQVAAPRPPAAAPPRPPAAGPPRPHRAIAAARREPEPAPPTDAPALPAPAASPTPRAPDRAPEERSYDDAWAALRDGDFAHAAGGFARVVLLAPDSPLGEDASYWRAVALARGRRSLEAVSAFHDFLDGHARSPRTGAASAMLGWLLIDARAFDEAERRFAAAAGDPDPAVRGSARAGLEALAGRKP